MTFCYSHRSAPHLVIIREGFCCSRWKQSPTTRKCVESYILWKTDTKCGVYYKSLFSGIRELCRRGSCKSLRAGRDGGQQGKKAFQTAQLMNIYKLTKNYGSIHRTCRGLRQMRSQREQRWTHPPTLTSKLTSIHSHLQKEISFLQMSLCRGTNHS